MTGNFVTDLLIIVVGLPVLLGVGGDVAKRWIRMREKEMELKAARPEGDNREYLEIIRKLEERLRVLERIATDPGVNVAAQIEALRDEVDGEMEQLKQKQVTRRQEATQATAERARDEELN